MKKLSICIPTFNRDRFLREALESITAQFVDLGVFNNVSVTILDNRSNDETKKVVADFTGAFSNITYVEDSERRGLAPGIAKAAALATGEYIWIFSDDDIQRVGAISAVLRIIENNAPDLVICNVDSFIEKNTVHETNLLVLKKDEFLPTRPALLSFLNTKFPTTIDYYTTYCSNWILKRKVFENYRSVLDKYNGPLDLFPFPSLIFYAPSPCTTVVIADRLVLFRADNALWAKKNKFQQFFYSDRLWRHHYRLIVASNKAILPALFAFRVQVKNILRLKNLFLLVVVHVCQKLGIYTIVRNMYKKFF